MNCRLSEVVKVVIRPFVEHCAKHCELSCAQEVTITTKGGPASDIGQQQADSNVCAFSSVLFLGVAAPLSPLQPSILGAS